MTPTQYISYFIDNRRVKRSLWYRIQRRRDAWEQKFAFLFRQVLNKQYNQLAERLTADNYRSESLMDNITEAPIEQAMIDLYKAVGSDFAERQLNTLKGIDPDIKRKDEDNWYGIMVNHIKRKAGNKITSINKTTRDQAQWIIRRALRETVTEGLGADETARYLRKELLTKGVELNQWRALRIARTEIMSASNIGAMEGAKASGEDLEKWWLATYDSRTRDTHMAVEQQNPKGMDEMFHVGAALMQQPGEATNGDFPEEVINCRCAISFKPKGYNVYE